MSDPDYTAQDLRIFQYRLDGASDDWIMNRLSVDDQALLVSRNRMTRCVAAWFDVDYQAVDTFIDANRFDVLSRVMAALEELSRISRLPISDEEGSGDTGDHPEPADAD